MLEVASLGSGSKGNATLIRSATTILMVDCGFSLRETERRLLRLSVSADSIDGMLVTHEHSDHLKGVAAFANKYDLPVWLSCSTAAHKLAQSIRHPVLINRFLSPMLLGDIEIIPVPVPHDAAEACQFMFVCNQSRVGVLTDLGHISALVREQFLTADLLLLEFNYDPQMLELGPYPGHLKQRVGGAYGHLSNQQALAFANQFAPGQLKKLIAMHISEKNNSPVIVEDMLSTELLDKSISYQVACQREGFNWISV